MSIRPLSTHTRFELPAWPFQLLALIGLFSKNALEKLRELFNVLFQTNQDSLKAFFDRIPEGEAKEKLKELFPELRKGE